MRYGMTHPCRKGGEKKGMCRGIGLKTVSIVRRDKRTVKQSMTVLGQHACDCFASSPGCPPSCPSSSGRRGCGRPAVRTRVNAQSTEDRREQDTSRARMHSAWLLLPAWYAHAGNADTNMQLFPWIDLRVSHFDHLQRHQGKQHVRSLRSAVRASAGARITHF